MQLEKQFDFDCGKAESPTRWIEGQQVSLASSLIGLAKSPTISQQKSLLDLVGWRHDFRSDDAYVNFIQKIPESALENLSRLSFPQAITPWHDAHNLWTKALDRLKWEGKRSPLAGAKLIANRIMAGILNPAQLIRVVKNELGREWSNDGKTRDALSSLIEELNPSEWPESILQTRLNALLRFREKVALSRWDLVENAILQQSYAWPIVVIRGLQQKSAIAIPIGVDVILDKPRKPIIISSGVINYESWDSPVSTNPKMIHLDTDGRSAQFSSPIERALEAARAQWLHSHGVWDKQAKNAVAGSSVRINLLDAEAIVAPFAKRGTFELIGDSHEVYLGLAILSQFLRRRSLDPFCATGRLKEEKRDKSGGDWTVEPPGEVDIKLDAMQRLHIFDKMIVPTRVHLKETRTNLRLCRGSRFSEFAAHAFNQDASRHRYIRCPDLAFSFKPTFGETDHDEVNLILNFLRQNRETIYECNFRPTSIIRALYRINEASAQWARKNEKPVHENIGSFAIVRVVPDEINERFWQVIWEAIGGDSDTFDKFRYTVSTEAPATILANELNRFSPSKEELRRAPDILVIVGSQSIDTPSRHFPRSPFSRLHFESLKKTLKSKLIPTAVEGIGQQIGKTRIILIPNESTDFYTIVAKKHIPIEIGPDIDGLSAYVFGFTFAMAQHLLDLETAECQDLLNRLCGDAKYGRQYAEYAESIGQYYLKARIEEKLVSSDFHFQAANSIAKFLDRRKDVVTLNYEEALSPAWMHEALHHLRETPSGLQFPTHRAARERLSRLGEIFGWTRVRWAIRKSNENGEELLYSLKDLLDDFASKSLLLHPIELTLGAKLVFQFARAARHLPALQVVLDELKLDWRKLLTTALATARGFGQLASRSARDEESGNREATACEFQVRTARACMIMAESPNWEGVREAIADIEYASSVKGESIPPFELEWYEYLGDSEIDNHKALGAYSSGMIQYGAAKASDVPVQLLIKYLGAAKLMNVPVSREVGEKVKRIKPKAKDYVFKTVVNQRNGIFELEHVKDRWRIGRNIVVSSL